jgi:hypothetical protein
MVATLACSAVGLALASQAIRRLHPQAADDAVPTYAAATWRAVALPLVLIGATEALMNRTGVLLLGWIGDTKGAGASAWCSTSRLWSRCRAPLSTHCSLRRSRVCLRGTTRPCCKSSCEGGSVDAGRGSHCRSRSLDSCRTLLAWFGPGFEGGVSALRILLLGQVIVSGTGSQQYVMIMTGHERNAAAILISCAAANAVGCTVLIGFLGLTGAAISTTATLIAWNVAMAVFIWRRLGLRPGVFAMPRWPLGKGGVDAWREGSQ